MDGDNNARGIQPAVAQSRCSLRVRTSLPPRVRRVGNPSILESQRSPGGLGAGLDQWTRARTHPQGQLLPLGARGLAREVGDTGPHHRYTGPRLRRGVRLGSLPSGCLCLAQSGIPQIRVEGRRLLQERTAQQMGQRAGRPAHPARACSEEGMCSAEISFL